MRRGVGFWELAGLEEGVLRVGVGESRVEEGEEELV